MAEPNTPNVGLIVPNTGDQVGTWGSASLNPDFVAIDGMLGGVATISLSATATTTLTLPGGSLTPSAGPTQSQNSCIYLQGTLTGNQIIQLGMPGRYVFHNKCLPLNFFVQVTSAGAGTAVGLPPGKKCTIFHDGVNVDFVDMPDPGTAYDLHGATVLPAWMTACTTRPYLIKDGTIYTMAAYPILGAMLSNKFGGDGVSNFAVPNELARMRVPFDTVGTGLMTSPVNAQIMGSAGGEQAHTLITGEMPAHSHPITDLGHAHNLLGYGLNGGNSNTTLSGNAASSNTIATQSAQTGITIQNAGGGGSHNNVQPSIVSFLALIKT